MPKERFDHQAIEKAAQEKWEAAKLYETDLAGAKDPYYLLFEFPYPSGDLHIGHWYAFALTDIYARLLRMKGKDVLFPIGFDAFGLPAENAAMRNGADPKEWTYANMDRMRAQIRSMGTSVDWSKEVVTCDPEYYRWTQWLFGKLYEHGLAYRATAPVKWCPKDQTVLANEQVVDGACERCGTAVEEKKLTQWFMKITEYAERLLQDLEPLPWREEIKEAQRQWIGKSEGARLWFGIKGSEERIEVFTTRPDTVFGATYVVIAPEHPLVASLPAENRGEVAAYMEATKKKTERERSENKEKTGVEMKGVRAVNPANGEEIPVFVADYVLATYGTGAVMAVPAHDERDFEFAKKHGLPIREVIAESVGIPNAEEEPRYIATAIIENAEGKVLIQSQDRGEGKVYCLPGGGIDEGETPEQGAVREAKEETGYYDFADIRKIGAFDSHYWNPLRKLHRRGDEHSFAMRLASEARKEPEFTDHEKKATIDHEWLTVSEAEQLLRTKGVPGSGDLPALLRFKEGNLGPYTGDGLLINSGEFSGKNNREALADIVKHAGGEKTTNFRIRDWLVSRQRYWGCPIPVVYDPEGKAHLVPPEHLPWTLPTDVDFTPTGEAPLASSKELKERVTRIFGEGWTPEYDTLDTFVDSSWYYLRYLSPHGTEHFTDNGLTKAWLPVHRYSGGSEHTTMHLLYARFFHKALYDLALVPQPEPFHERFNRGLILGPDGQKMSKSKGNVVNPDEFVSRYGADAVRMYLAFIGPYNEPGSYPWQLDGVEAMRRFLDRVDAMSERLSDAEAGDALARAAAKAAAKVASDTERFKLNTAISALMVLVNALSEAKEVPRAAFLDLVRLMAPYAPHLAEHLWAKAGGEGPSVHAASFPVPDESLLTEDEAVIAVQVDGKRRGEVRLPKDAGEEEAVAAALTLPAVQNALSGRSVARNVFVKGRLLNLVTG